MKGLKITMKDLCDIIIVNTACFTHMELIKGEIKEYFKCKSENVKTVMRWLIKPARNARLESLKNGHGV